MAPAMAQMTEFSIGITASNHPLALAVDRSASPEWTGKRDHAV
jgi:hypothetical protein